ncbi:MAG: FtsK/SpoIIIE domain-containing protein [Actinomycetota bacterium]
MAGLEIGRRFDGRPLVLPWPRCQHILIGGETGGGKSGVVNAILWVLAAMPGVAICGIDLKLVELWPWRDRLTSLASTPEEADRLLVQLRNLIRQRMLIMRSLGVKRWPIDIGPWVVVLVDELAELHALDADTLAAAVDGDSRARKDAIADGKSGQQVRVGLLGALARLSRACGVTIVTATQYPSAEVIDQQIRTQMTIRIMMRVASAEQVNVILGRGYAQRVAVRDIPPTERGGLYLLGTPDALLPVRGRAHWTSDHAIGTRVAETRQLAIPPDQLFVPPADPVDQTAEP